MLNMLYVNGNQNKKKLQRDQGMSCMARIGTTFKTFLIKHFLCNQTLTKGVI